MVTGRSKGVTFRGKGNVVLVAAQLDDPDGNPTEEYVFLRADEFGRLRTIDAGAIATFLGLTDTPASYAGQALLFPRVNAAEDALEFVAGGGGANDRRQLQGITAERWSVPGWFASDQDLAEAMTAGEQLWVPIFVPQARTQIRIGIVVTAAGAGGTVARLGIYNATLAADGLTPGTLLLDAGTVAVDGIAAVEIIISQALAADTWYFLTFVTDGTPDVAIFENLQGLAPPVSGWAADLVSGGDGDVDVGVLRLGGQGVGALADPSDVPNDEMSARFGGVVRLRDV